LNGEFAVGFDQDLTGGIRRNAGLNFLNDLIRLFGTGVIAREECDVGVARNSVSHQGTFGTIAVTAGAEDANHPTGSETL